jgi:hypothetical protein
LFAVGNTTFSRFPGAIPVLRSDNDGATWIDASQGLPQIFSSETALWAIAVDPTDNNILYAATDNGLFKTTNAGAL